MREDAELREIKLEPPHLLSVTPSTMDINVPVSERRPVRWSADALARLPPNVARLIGLPPPEVRRRGFALGGGVFAGGDVRAGTEMTTPEVLRSTR